MANTEIQVGEYCRTFDGDIFKVAGFYEKGNIYTMVDERGVFFGNPRKVAKTHSFNIIDLIEVGDYVNGNRVVNVINKEPCPSGKCVDIDSAKQSEDCTFWEEDIKTIVTHEQFKSMEYKVGGEDEQS